MERVAEKLQGRRRLHDLPEVHDRDAVADVLHHRQVVGDEKIGELHGLLEFLQQVQYLGLDGYVKGGDGLVADDEARRQGERPGDAHPLASAPVELVGVFVEEPGAQAHFLHEGVHHFLPLPLRAHAEDLQGLADGLPDALSRVEGGEGVLKDDLHFLPHVVEGLFVRRGDVTAAVEDPSGRGLDEPYEEPSRGGLAAARLAHETEGLPFLYGEGYVVHGVDVSRRHGKILDQVFDLDEIRHERRPPSRRDGTSPCARRRPLRRERWSGRRPCTGGTGDGRGTPTAGPGDRA